MRQPFDAGALSTTRATAQHLLRGSTRSLRLTARAQPHHRIEMLARVRVFWIEACVGYYTREASSVPWSTPGRIYYRPETRLPEQSCAECSRYSVARGAAPLPNESPNSRKEVYCDRRRGLPHHWSWDA